MLKWLVRKEEEEGRGVKPPVLLAARTGLLRRLGSASRGYTLAGTGVVAASVVVVSLLSWLAPDSDRPIASPLEAVGRVASGVIEQVDEQVEALLGTDEEKTLLRSVRDGVSLANSATLWPPVNSSEVTAIPSTGPGGSSSSGAPTRGGESSLALEGAPASQQPASSTPSPSRSGTSEAPITTTDAPSSSPTAAEPSAPPPSTEEPLPTAEEPPPTVEEPPPTVEEPSPPPLAQEPPAAEEPAPPPSAEEPPPAMEDPPPAAEEPPPPTEEPPPAASDLPPPPEEGQPGTIVDE